MRANELVAGTELDAMVAEKVMGMTSLGGGWFDHPKGSTSPHLPPPFSTDRGAAFGVVEKMQMDWFSFKAWMPSKQMTEDFGRGDYAVVSFVCGFGPCERHHTDFHNHHGAYDIEAPSLALAICRAALVAVKAAEAPDQGVRA